MCMPVVCCVCMRVCYVCVPARVRVRVRVRVRLRSGTLAYLPVEVCDWVRFRARGRAEREEGL